MTLETINRAKRHWLLQWWVCAHHLFFATADGRSTPQHALTGRVCDAFNSRFIGQLHEPSLKFTRFSDPVAFRPGSKPPKVVSPRAHRTADFD
jgi:hypothetical protein